MWLMGQKMGVVDWVWPIEGDASIYDLRECLQLTYHQQKPRFRHPGLYRTPKNNISSSAHDQIVFIGVL